MINVEPGAAIAVIESDLRRLTERVLSAALGQGWLKDVLTADKLHELERRRGEERKRRSPAGVPDALLAYTHVYELRRIIESQWEDFKPAFGDRKEFAVFLDKVEDYRNAPAHSRELLPHERHLLEGIAGFIRTQATRYVSETDRDAKHYPIIEWVRDSFGNELEPDLTTFGTDRVDTGLRLQVGQVVRFECRAWDSQGRTLLWRWSPPGLVAQGTAFLARGAEAELEWLVREDDVQQDAQVSIMLLSEGRFHRHGSFDQHVGFYYDVEPPA